MKMRSRKKTIVVISFRPMLNDEFTEYLSYFIVDYSEEISENYAISLDAAIDLAKREIANDLPDGPSTIGHHLFCIVSDVDGLATHIGYVWYKQESQSDQAYIGDFHILPPFQTQGFGKLSVDYLDTHLAQFGVKQIRLRVAMNNEVAMHLYESSGFCATGVNMFKQISSSRDGS